ncbi:MAG: nuclear transport factor 2 family protein [Actinobacteria bacterium]|nr:nuclear transport factor 2 family protein [Actinomycetota bacterium]
MSEHPNAIAARDGLDAFTRGDPETLTGLLAEDVVWHAPGSNQYAGTFVGKQATMERMQRMAREGIIWDFAIHDVLANDDHVVVLIDATLTKGSGTAHGRQCQVMHVHDGKWTEFWAVNEDQAGNDAVLNG